MSNLFSSGGAGNVGFSGETQQSLKFNDDETQYLSWTPSSAGNRKTWTWSGWVKRSNLGLQRLFTAGTSGSSYLQIRFDTDDEILCSSEQPSTVLYLKTTQKFRDTSAWYHLVVVMDTTQSTAADRTKLYVNGSLVTDFSSTTRPSQNTDLLINSSTAHMIGALSYGATSNPYDGYLSDIHFIDGQALDASSFGETVDGYWKKKDYTGTYGTNGFRLTFEDDVVSEGFNCITYRGTGATQSISGLGFEPDFVWIKDRTTAYDHHLFDTVRGGGNSLYSNDTVAENTYATDITFDADGFTVADGSGVPQIYINKSGDSFVAWAWDAGSGSAASNTDGSITSTVKANPDYGFSVITYTGAGSSMTFGHGLGVEPELHIIKRRDSADEWLVYAQSLGLSQALNLHNTNAAFSDSAYESISSTVIGIGNSGARNASGGQYVCYAFASVAGYSSIGSYTGNGSASGPTVTTGFAPAFVMVKRTDNAGGWNIIDNTRDVNTDLRLQANTADAEAALDTTFTNTGFILDTTASSINASGGTYIYMAFADTREAAFWKDVSGQGNHWTPNNLDYRDSLLDSPANNFATLNATFATSNSASTGGTLSEGNLRITTTGGFFKGGTFAPSSGKWYFEGYAESVGAQMSISFADYSAIQTGYPYVGYLSGGGLHQIDGSAQDSAGTHATWTSGDIISVAVDIDAGKIWWAKNGTYIDSGDPAAGTNAPTTFTAGTEVVPYFMCDNASGTKTWKANFGQDSTFSGATTAGGNQDDNGIGDFKYAPPSGYLALCTANLPEPTIVDGSEHFNTVAYTGTGTTNAITVGFSPDFTWIKQRNTTRDHQLLDIVRGYTNNILYSNLTNAEDIGGTARIDSRDADGFTVNTPAQVNQSGGTYASWSWKAGGTAVSNTAGSITSQVSANVDAGFSIVGYTGNTTTNTNFTIGHGLGKTPDLVIIKNRDWAAGVKAWQVWASPLGNNALGLDATNSQSSGDFTYSWNQQPNSTTFTVRADTSVSTTNRYRTNGRTDDYIAYVFANTDGYLKAGSYTGNGSSDGPFVYTGFRPAWVMIKRTDSAKNWHLSDNKRDLANPEITRLFPNLSNAENAASGYAIDFVSQGIKIRNTDSDTNASGGTYIYLAFAETPFKYANAR